MGIRIALLGYGRMGQMVERLALAWGDSVTLRATSSTSIEEITCGVEAADVVVEFTRPDSAVGNIELCLRLGAPVVCGTTGWYDHLPQLRELMETQYPDGACIYAPNFSVGVNIMLDLNARLSEYLRRFPSYAVSLREVHHTRKLDAPSGTALALAAPYLAPRGPYSQWMLSRGEGEVAPTAEAGGVLPIEAVREGDVPGIHTVRLLGNHDELALTHSAHGREGFAAGALEAAHAIVGRHGLMGFRDLFFQG